MFPMIWLSLALLTMSERDLGLQVIQATATMSTSIAKTTVLLTVVLQNPVQASLVHPR